MADNSFRHAAQQPALCARSAVRRHRNNSARQIIDQVNNRSSRLTV
jgi:hypothetical protein